MKNNPRTNPLPGNPHNVDAGHVTTFDGHEITKALEAFAFEQRTANLIAFANLGSTTTELSNALEQIEMRLGFRDN